MDWLFYLGQDKTQMTNIYKQSKTHKKTHYPYFIL